MGGGEKRVCRDRDNDITGVLEQTFSVDEEEFGQIITHDLCENGRNVPVTEDNKKRYVQYGTATRQCGKVSDAASRR